MFQSIKIAFIALGVACYGVASAQPTSQPQAAPLDKSPASSSLPSTIALVPPALTAVQEEKPSNRNLYINSAALTVAWGGGILATIPFAERADAHFDFDPDTIDPAPDSRAQNAGFLLNTSAKLSLNAAMVSLGVARFCKTQKARPLYILAFAGAVHTVARGLGFAVYAAEGDTFFGGENSPSEEGIYIPAYEVGLLSASGVTIWASNAITYSVQKRRERMFKEWQNNLVLFTRRGASNTTSK